MNNLVIYGLIALLVIVLLYKGRSYFDSPAPAPAPAPAAGAPAPQWKATMIIKQGDNCPDASSTKIGEVMCAK